MNLIRGVSAIKKIQNKTLLRVFLLLILILFLFKTVWWEVIVAHPYTFLAWGADSTGNVVGRESFWYTANYVTYMTAMFLVPLLKLLIILFGIEILKRILLKENK